LSIFHFPSHKSTGRCKSSKLEGRIWSVGSDGLNIDIGLAKVTKSGRGLLIRAIAAGVEIISDARLKEPSFFLSCLR
jgi:hypothetical protein